MKPLSVFMVSLHGCVRTHKMGWGLCCAGLAKVHMSASRYAPTHSWNLYDSVNLWNPQNEDGTLDWVQLAKSVQFYSSSVDIFHVSNEPNWIFKVVRENTDKPVIWDIHDWTSIREEKNLPELEYEKYALENASGFILPSRGYLKRVRAISKKPSTLIYSKVPSPLFPVPQDKTHPGLCYEGGVKGKNADFEYNFPYRNWAAWAKEAVKSLEGNDEIYFYSANTGEDFGDYNDHKIKMSDPILYNVLLASMGRHTAGLVGSPYPIPDFEDSMPNKLFEYTAAGIPCIVINSPEALEYVEQNGLGVGIREPSELGAALASLTDHRVLMDRWSFTMESEMTKLIEFYREVISQCQGRRRLIPQDGVP